jgi:hypothetical protein
MFYFSERVRRGGGKQSESGKQSEKESESESENQSEKQSGSSNVN